MGLERAAQIFDVRKTKILISKPAVQFLWPRTPLDSSVYHHEKNRICRVFY